MNTQYSKLLKNVLGHLFRDLLSHNRGEYWVEESCHAVCLSLRLTAVVFFHSVAYFSGLFFSAGGKNVSYIWEVHFSWQTRTHTNPKWNCESNISHTWTIWGSLNWPLYPLSFSFSAIHRVLSECIPFVRHLAGVLPGVWHEKTHPRTFRKKKKRLALPWFWK